MNQIQIYGIIRHALTFGAGYIAAKGWINASDVPQIVSAAMTLAGVLWSVHEKIGQAPGTPGAPPMLPPGAVSAIVLCGLCSLLLTAPGCSTPSTGGNATAANVTAATAEQVAVVSQIVQSGTQLGVAAAVMQKPELRPYFEASREALNTLIATQTTDPAQLQAYLNQSVPAAYQPLVDAALQVGVTAYTTWYQENATQLTASDTAKYALQILSALDAGLNAALVTPPPPAPPAVVPAG